jgi:hypothetical protein
MSPGGTIASWNATIPRSSLISVSDNKDLNKIKLALFQTRNKTKPNTVLFGEKI